MKRENESYRTAGQGRETTVGTEDGQDRARDREVEGEKGVIIMMSA